MRRRRPDLPRPFRVPGYPWVPLFFLLVSVALIGNALVQHTRSSLFGLALLLAGVPVYYARRWFKPAALGVTGLDP